MKTHFRNILCIFTVLCAVLCLAACSKQSGDSSNGDPQAEIQRSYDFIPGEEMVGTYKLHSISDGSQTIEGDDLKEYFPPAIGEISDYLSLELREDGTGILFYNGEGAEIVLDETCFWTKDNEEEVVEYTFAEGEFTFTMYDGITYVFVLTPEEA